MAGVPFLRATHAGSQLRQGSLVPQTAPPRLHFRVPPAPSNLLRARERMRDYLRQYCTEGQVIDDVVLCVEEACTNAIRHSGSGDEIEISLQFDRDRLEALVKDRGQGFDIASFDPQLPADPRSERGRGLVIIAALMDSLELRLDGGLEVRMARCAALCAEPAPFDSSLGDALTGTPTGNPRMRAVLEEIDEGFVALDWEYRYTHVNEAILRLMGKSRDEVLGKVIWELFPELIDTPVQEDCRAAMELGRPSVIEHRSLLSGDWFEMRIYPTSAGISIYFRDINERKRVEEESERRANLLDLSFEPIIVWRLGGGIESWNRGAAQLYGYSAHEALGQVRHELLGTTGMQPWGTIEAALRKHGSWEGELVHRAKDGREVVVLSRHQLLVAGDGVERILESNRDITERKQAEQRLLERETEAARLDPGSRTTRLVDRFRGHHWGVLFGAIAIQSAILAALNTEHNSRHILGLPGSMIALLSVLAGALAGPLVGALVAVAGGGVFYLTVGDRGTQSTILTTVISTLIWVAAGLLSGFLAKTLSEQAERRRAAAVALVRSDAAREAQLAEQARVEELAAALQLQTEELQAAGEELSAQRDELSSQNEQLSAQRDNLSEQTTRTSLLKELAEVGASSLGSAETAQRQVETLMRTLKARTIFLFVADDSGQRLVPLTQGGVTEEYLEQHAGPIDISGQDSSARVFRTRRPSFIPHVESDPTLSESGRALTPSLGQRSGASLPLLVRDKAIGCLALAWAEPHAFDADEVSFLESVAFELALGLENARLLEREQEAAKLNTALAAVDRAIHSSLDFAEVMQTALREGAAVIGAETAGTSMHEDEAQRFRVAYIHNYPPDKLGVLIPDVDDTHGVEAMRVGKTLAISDTHNDPRVVAPLMDAWNIKSVICAPLVVQGRPIAVAYFNYHSAAHRFSEEEINFVTKFATSLSGALENARLYEEGQAELARTKVMKELAAAAASSLEPAQLSERVLTTARELLEAEIGSVYLADEDGRRARHVAHFGYPARSVDGLHEVAIDGRTLTGRALLSGEIETAGVSDYPEGTEQRAQALGLSAHRMIAVPVRAHGTVVGVVALGFRGRRPFSDDEIGLYHAIVEQLSVGLDNAHLYTEQRRIAQTLQESFIHELPRVPGLELGLVAKTAYEPDLVGGDFSDVFVVDDTHVVALIGDVAGKGVRAAGLTETVRSTVRALAATDPSPAFILGKTNELLLRFDPDEPHVTAFCAVLDPHTGHLSYASAGHPAPVHLGAFSCRPLDVTFGPPLGSFERPYPGAHAMLTLEDYLVLYTDGVTEARRGGELLGEQRLLEVVAGQRGRSAQEVAEGVRGAALDFAGQLRDDLQVVVLRLA